MKQGKNGINFFEQLKSFYEGVWHGENEFTTHHIALYFFLVNQNNRNEWAEWFKVSFDLGMKGSCIGSKTTYYKTLKNLEEWGYIRYEEGANAWKTPRISVVPLSSKGRKIPYMEGVAVQNDTTNCTAIRESTNTSTSTSTGNLLVPLLGTNKDYKTNTRPNTLRLKTYSSEFLEFYAAYPRKLKKDQAHSSFLKAIAKTTLGTMLMSLERYKASSDWQKDGGKWIPHPTTWLNGEYWNDNIEVEDTQSWAYLNKELLRGAANGQDHIAIGRDNQSL